jgi:hypothetical protein
MPDNWSYVAAAYALSALALCGYWRYLVRRSRAAKRARRRANRT